jgi:hypothetical protein
LVGKCFEDFPCSFAAFPLATPRLSPEIRIKRAISRSAVAICEIRRVEYLWICTEVELRLLIRRFALQDKTRTHFLSCVAGLGLGRFRVA